MNLSFDQLPQAVNDLSDKIDKIERLLLQERSDPKPEADNLLTIQQAAEIIHLSVPTVYGLVHRASIPVSKRGKRLYFSKQELISWIMAGRKKTVAEIEAEVDAYTPIRKRKQKF
jgi:excisionase family DNA binding protein